MSDEDTAEAAAPDPYSQESAMNYSNADFERISERIERSKDDTQVITSHLEGANLKSTSPVKKPPAQMMAASTLAGFNPVVPIGMGYVEEDNDPDCDFQIPLRFTKSGRRRATPFPMKLMKVLSTRRYNDIICWTPDGKGFSILRPKAFADDILPKYFKEAKYSSFTRKLHRWGFQRHLRGVDTGAFYHRNFQRGRLDLLDLMTCYKPRETSARAAGKFPKSSRSSSQSQSSQQSPSMPPVDMIAQAQAIRARQQFMGIPPSLGDLSEETLNAAIELEVSRRLQERVEAASLSRLAMMQQASPAMSSFDRGMGMHATGYPPVSSPGRLPSTGPLGMGPAFDNDRNVRLQQARALRFTRGYEEPRTRGYEEPRFSSHQFDDQQQPHHHQQQYYDPNMDNMGRGA